MEDKEVWLILFHALISSNTADNYLVRALADDADEALDLFRDRYPKEDEE